MPAMLDDPTAAPIWRVSGEGPFPTPGANLLPDDVFPTQVTLRDRITTATLLPFSSAAEVPPRLLSYLADQLNREIEKGDTYPMVNPMPVPYFGQYWFQNFGAIMIVGEALGSKDLFDMERGGADWSRQCLGSFYVKPNYPGRSSHVCNGGFLVTDAARNKGVGRLMGECYLEWAPKLGYTYSVFNLVYETNVASCKIWDALGFKRIGRVKGCGNLKSYPDEYVDAIIYGRELGPEGEDFAAEERFDKIRFYLKNGKYPAGADRAEKSRLRSAATHYKLLPPLQPEEEDRLMLKDKEVISDPHKQYEIARALHLQSHGGINRTTATVAEKYHWVRIKDTVSLVIKNCTECREQNKAASARAEANHANNQRKAGNGSLDPNQDIERIVNFDDTQQPKRSRRSPIHDDSHESSLHESLSSHPQFSHIGDDVALYGLPLDPQIMQYNHAGLGGGVRHDDALLHHHHHHHQQQYHPGSSAHDLGSPGMVTNGDVDDLEHELLSTGDFSHTVQTSFSERD